MIRKPHNKTTKPAEDKAEGETAEERQAARKSNAGTANTTKDKEAEEGRAATKPKKRKPIRPQDAVPPPPLPPQIAAANAADEEADDDIPELPPPVDGVELLDDESASSTADGDAIGESDGEE